ncbi:hypothetical protein MMC21_006006 [Puttea exsequens]|nr:hypothetical protein [Puttea exsequens]
MPDCNLHQPTFAKSVPASPPSLEFQILAFPTPPKNKLEKLNTGSSSAQSLANGVQEVEKTTVTHSFPTGTASNSIERSLFWFSGDTDRDEEAEPGAKSEENTRNRNGSGKPRTPDVVAYYKHLDLEEIGERMVVAAGKARWKRRVMKGHWRLQV